MSKNGQPERIIPVKIDAYVKTTSLNQVIGRPVDIIHRTYCNLGLQIFGQTADQGYTGIGARPDRPTDLKATDGSYTDRVQLMWTTVKNATIYRVFRCQTTGQTCGSPIGFTNSDFFEDTGGEPGTVYFYRLKACTTANCSSFSALNAGHRGTGSFADN